MGLYEKLKLLKKCEADNDVRSYVINLLKPLFINIDEENVCGYIIELMNQKALEGWCWPTTESSIIFFNENDYIVRGTLLLEDTDSIKNFYKHSWICFEYKNKKYIFDPCLNLIVDKKLYDKVFDVKEKAISYSKVVREKLFLKILTGNIDKCNINDINDPMYKNYTDYEMTLSNGDIKRLVANYKRPSIKS